MFSDSLFLKDKSVRTQGKENYKLLSELYPRPENKIQFIHGKCQKPHCQDLGILKESFFLASVQFKSLFMVYPHINTTYKGRTLKTLVQCPIGLI